LRTIEIGIPSAERPGRWIWSWGGSKEKFGGTVNKKESVFITACMSRLSNNVEDRRWGCCRYQFQNVARGISGCFMTKNDCCPQKAPT
jgi:hypothetical protein